MARLYSDLIDGTGRRYYFGLSSAPGGITNSAPALITFAYSAPTIQEQSTVFRNPATAMLTLFGYSPPAGVILQPALAALSMGGQIPGLAKLQVITNALPPDYTALPDNTPVILYIATQTPAQAALTINYLQPNVTQGGNIGFVSPGRASLTLFGYVANLPRFAEVGTITIDGLVATLSTELIISPDPASLVADGLAASLGSPFVWVDDLPAIPPTWIDDPRA